MKPRLDLFDRATKELYDNQWYKLACKDDPVGSHASNTFAEVMSEIMVGVYLRLAGFPCTKPPTAETSPDWESDELIVEATRLEPPTEQMQPWKEEPKGCWVQTIPYSSDYGKVARKCGRAINKKCVQGEKHAKDRPFVVALAWSSGSMIGCGHKLHLEIGDVLRGICLDGLWNRPRLSGVVFCREYGLDWYFGYIKNPNTNHPIEMPNLWINNELIPVRWSDFDEQLRFIATWVTPAELGSLKTGEIKWQKPESFAFVEGERYLAYVYDGPRGMWRSCGCYVVQYKAGNFVKAAQPLSGGFQLEEIGSERIHEICEIPEFCRVRTESCSSTPRPLA